MNEYDIDDLVTNCRDCRRPVLRAAAHTLSQFRDWVNANSDGWPYWTPPSRAAKRLMALAQSVQTGGYRSRDDEDITEADYKRALIPIKSFLTKHKVDHASVVVPAPPSPKEKQ